MKVHSELGNGFQEVIYQRSLAIQMEIEGINFTREYEIPVYYSGLQVGTRRVDFLVEDCVMVELKAITTLEDVHLAQALNYLEAYNIENGLLINFGSSSMTFKRLFNKKAKEEFRQTLSHNTINPANPVNQENRGSDN